ncbi:MAG: PEP-CTERM sorting domain-containing protein [Planctomycetota bacterium]
MRKTAERLGINSTMALLVSVAVVFVFSGRAAALPVTDGRFDPNEGYNLGRNVSFTVEGSAATVTGGQLWTHVDDATGDVHVVFIQPLELVDNTYGETAVGWGGDAPSGKRHELNDLVESDMARFVFADTSGQTVLDVTMDYISGHAKSYGCLGVTGGDGEVTVGSAASVLGAATSLDYNFNTLGYVLTKNSPATDDAYAENPGYPGWIFEVVYELHVAGSAFGESGFGDLTVPIVHDSPNKIGKGKVYPEIEYIPEPVTLCLLCLGGLFTALRRRP